MDKMKKRFLDELPESGCAEEPLSSFLTVFGEGGDSMRADSVDCTLRWTAPLALRVGVDKIDVRSTTARLLLLAALL